MTVSCVVKAFRVGASQSLGSHLALRASQVQDQFRESMFETLPRRAVVVRLLRAQTVCLPPTPGVNHPASGGLLLFGVDGSDLREGQGEDVAKKPRLLGMIGSLSPSEGRSGL